MSEVAGSEAPALVRFLIDGREAAFEEGTTVLEAARTLGIEIPTLCFNEAVSVYGACRLCVVEVTSHGRTRLTASCTYPVAEGLEVRTDTDEIRRARRLVVEMLLAKSPGAQPLLAVARALGVDTPGRWALAADDQNDCILCGLCARVCREIVGAAAIDFAERGTRIRGGPVLPPAQRGVHRLRDLRHRVPDQLPQGGGSPSAGGRPRLGLGRQRAALRSLQRLADGPAVPPGSGDPPGPRPPREGGAVTGVPIAVPSCCGADPAPGHGFQQGRSDTDTGRPARIGVLLCACGVEMRSRLQFDALSSYASSLDGVAHVEVHPAWCLKPGLRRLDQVVVEKGLDRLVVGGCSYRTHRHIFAAALERCGLNPHLFDIANLKEQCAAVHPDGAMTRATGQIAMAVAQVAALEPIDPIYVQSEPRALVIGGSLSGLVAAETLAGAGIETVLVEQAPLLGGRAGGTRERWPGTDYGEEIDERIATIRASSLITIHLSSTLVGVAGGPGQFVVTIRTPQGDEAVRVGAIVLATGSRQAPPKGAYDHNGKCVRTQEEFTELLHDETRAQDPPLSVVMIQCVGSRDAKRPYCSRVCCLHAVQNAIRARQRWPETLVAILFRDLEMSCLTERDVKHALEAGVTFHRYDPASPPQVHGLRVGVFDTLLGRRVEILSDLLVLSVGRVPGEGTAEAARVLRLDTDAYGFVPEPVVRLRPQEHAGRGIYVTGSAHWPASPEEATFQAFEMASRAAMALQRGWLSTRPIVATVDEGRCLGCGLCVSMCGFGAISIETTEKGRKASVRSILCKGCGTCTAGCPVFAIKSAFYGDAQIAPAIRAAVTP